MNASEKIAGAKVKLLMRSPFFGSILCKRPPILSDKVPTAGVDARGNLFVNPQFVDTLSVRQVMFLLAHETMHIVWQHPAREGRRDHMVWNIACDAIINHMLRVEGIGEPIEGTVDIRFNTDYTAEQLYDELVKEAKSQPAGGGDGQGDDGDEDSEGNGGGSGDGDSEDVSVRGYSSKDDKLSNDVDSKSASEMSDGERRQVEAENRATVAAAAMAAKMQGKGNGALQRMIDEILEVKTPWYQYLEKFMTAKAYQIESWSRPNKRYARFAYLPSTSPFPSMGPIVIGIDTSGSISQRELNEFIGHVNRIMHDVHPEKVYVVYCDSSVAHVDEFTEDDLPIKPTQAYGGGGTDMREIFRWVEKQDLEPDAVIVLTDGWTPYPDTVDFPAFWALTSQHDVPDGIGETIYIGE